MKREVFLLKATFMRHLRHPNRPDTSDFYPGEWHGFLFLIQCSLRTRRNGNRRSSCSATCPATSTVIFQPPPLCNISFKSIRRPEPKNSLSVCTSLNSCPAMTQSKHLDDSRNDKTDRPKSVLFSTLEIPADLLLHDKFSNENILTKVLLIEFATEIHHDH